MIRVVLPFYSEFDTLKPSLRALRESDIAHEVVIIQGSFPAKGRNNGISMNQQRLQKLPEHISHYLILDSDIAFTVSQLEAALKHDKMILGLPYLRHDNDGTYQAAAAMDPQGALSSFVHEKLFIRGKAGLHQIPFIGAGFLLIKKEALEKIQYPWFHHRIVIVNDAAENSGEDVGFCLAAREAGVDIWCDFDHPVYHRLRRHEHFNVSY